MPARDQSGPMGEGPMTGRGAGICSGAAQNEPGENRIWYPLHRFWRFGGSRRRGMRRNAGRGFGYGFQAAGQADRKDVLKSRKVLLEQELKDINQQLDQDA